MKASDKMMGQPRTVPLDGHIKNQIETICDAFGKGFDQSGRDLPNPYAEDSALHYAYEYGKETTHDRV